MKKLLDRLKSTGFFHIFSSQVLNKIVAFCSAIFIVRLLSQTDYGVYSAANNTLNIFLLFSGLGTTAAILQYGSESYQDPAKKGAYIRFGVKVGVGFNILLCAAMALWALFGPLGIQASKPFLLMLCLMPMLYYLGDAVAMCLRVDLLNKEYSLYNSLNTVLVFVATMAGALIGGISGVISLRYVAYLAAILITAYLGRKAFALPKGKSLTKAEKGDFLKIAVISTANNGISQMLYLIDVFLIGMIVKDAEILGSYNAAMQIPNALTFIPLAVMIYVYPYFARHNQDMDWVRRHYKKLLGYSALLNGVISLLLFVCAPLIIRILYGEKYMDSLHVFRILSIGYFFAAVFRIPSGNILVTLKRLRVNLIVSIASGVLNVALDAWFIYLWGSTGAAVATVSIYVFSGLCSTGYLLWLLYGKKKKRGTFS